VYRKYLQIERILFVHLNAIVPSSIRKFGRVRGIRRPAGCHDGDAHNWDLAYHGIIEEVLVVACELVRAPICRSMFIKNIREFLASLLYLFYFIFIFLISFSNKEV
jgi:hypothetical protein